MPPLARRLLWATGLGLDVLAIIGLLAEVEPDRVGSRIAGAVVLAAVGALALAAALLASRRPAVSRFLGLGSAVGMLFVAWLVLTQPGVNLLSILVWSAVIVVAATIGWQLFRWRPARASSGEAEDGAHVP